jgi:hypothetical protein
LPQWESWGSSGGQFLVFDSEAGGGLRLSEETLTGTQIVAQVANDDRFESAEERCEIYADFVQFSRRLTIEEYEAINDGICRGRPIGGD